MTSISSATHPATTRGNFKQRMLRARPDDTLPITLRHERIYILPTKRGLAFIFVVLVMLVASMNYGLNLGYALGFMMVGLFASSLLSTYLNLAQMQVVSATAEDNFEKQPIDFNISLTQLSRKTRHSITLSAHDTNDRIDINASDSSIAKLRVQAVQRGLIELGRITLSSDFPLGLWRGWGYVHTPVTAYVYPKPESPCPDFCNQITSDGNTAAAKRGEQEYKQLKRYQKTDSLGSVAWKQVAKGGDWYSKEFEPTPTSNNITVRWQDTPAHTNTEQRLSRMCAWVLAAQAQNLSYGFELPGVTIKTQTGPEHATHCLRLLATFRHSDST